VNFRSTMTNPTIQTIIEKLKKYPDVTYSTADDSITVDPKDEKGFSVSLGVGPRDIIVSSDFWHEHFELDEVDKALDCFAFMLSDSCRLKIEYRGEKPKRWTIESFENGIGLEILLPDWSISISGHRHGLSTFRTT
jgi:hypothetical protein